MSQIQSVLTDLVIAMEQESPSRILAQQDFYPLEYLVKKSKVISVSFLKESNEYLAKIQFDVIGKRILESESNGSFKTKTVLFKKPITQIETVRVKPGERSWIFTEQLDTPYRKYKSTSYRKKR
jgi:hypothetical protein